MLTAQEIEIIRALQGDMPLLPQPFVKLAARLGLTEKELLLKIRELKQNGIIRRFGAILRHQRAGMQANVMVVWRVPPDELERVGKLMALSPAITHCYERPVYPEWPYNLFTMVHAPNEEKCEEIIKNLAIKADLFDYQLLYTDKEYKKTSMRYFE